MENGERKQMQKQKQKKQNKTEPNIKECDAVKAIIGNNSTNNNAIDVCHGLIRYSWSLCAKEVEKKKTLEIVVVGWLVGGWLGASFSIRCFYFLFHFSFRSYFAFGFYSFAFCSVIQLLLLYFSIFSFFLAVFE